MNIVVVIGVGDLVGYVFLGERGDRLGGCDLHRFVDRGRADIKRAAEDVGEAQHVVDLIARIPPAVAKAAVDSGVARKPVEDMRAYRKRLESRLDPEHGLPFLRLRHG